MPPVASSSAGSVTERTRSLPSAKAEATAAAVERLQREAHELRGRVAALEESDFARQAAELAGAGMFLCLGLRFGPRPALGQWLVWAGLLLALSLTDAAERIIPDSLLLALAANRLLWLALLRERPVEAALEILMACTVPAVLLALVLAAEKLLGREVMGGGDLKLLFSLALYMSWAELLLGLLLSCLLGLLWAALAGRRGDAAVPFGPFLAAGALSAVCFGGPVIRWYFGLF